MRLPFVSKTASVLICIITLGYLVILGHTILSPLFFAFLMAVLFTPFANLLERKLRFPRGLSTIFSFLLLVICLVGVFYFFITQSQHFADDLPKLRIQIMDVVERGYLSITQEMNIELSQQMDFLQKGLDKLLGSSGEILGFTLSIFSSTGLFLIYSMLFFIFILNYRRLLYKFAVDVFDEKHRPKVEKIIMKIQKIIKQYIIGLLLQFILVGGIVSAFLFVLGIKYALFFGMLTGLLNVIPYLGITFSGGMTIIFAWATNGVDLSIVVMIGYVVIHIIDANIILPFVVGSKVKINALFSFLGLIIGEKMWGISGMFFSIPFLAILKIIFENIDGLEAWGQIIGYEISPRKQKKKYQITKNIVLEELD